MGEISCGRLKVIYLFILFLLSFNLADYLGGYSGAGFRYGNDARSMALANAIISTQNNGFNAFSNPALLSKVKNREIGLTQFSLSLDRYVQVLSLSQSINNDAGVSLSFFNSGVNKIAGKDFTNQSTGSFSSSEGFIMLSIGADVNRNFDLGLNIKTIFSSIDQYSANGISADIGVIYNISDRITIGIKMSDFFGKYTWDGLDDSSASFEEDMPSVNSAGFQLSPTEKIEVFYSLDFINISGKNSYRNRIGLEVERPKYNFRFGAVQNSSLEKIDFRYLLGLGSYLGSFQGHNVKLDYCIDFGKENEGISNLFTLTFEK